MLRLIEYILFLLLITYLTYFKVLNTKLRFIDRY